MFELRLVSCLTKVFCDEAPKPLSYAPEGLIGEVCAFQLAYKGGESSAFAKLKIISELDTCIRIYRVRNVPVGYAKVPGQDENYLRTDSGLYPDLLMPPQNEHLRIYPDRWEAVWLEIDPPDTLPGGEYPIRLVLTSDSDDILGEAETVYRRIAVKLVPHLHLKSSSPNLAFVFLSLQLGHTTHIFFPIFISPISSLP